MKIRGFYNTQKKTLLNDFNQTIEIMMNVEKYREVITPSIQKQLIAEYEIIIPTIPYFKGYRQRMFNNMLVVTAQILAAYKVLKRYDKMPEEIWEICHNALRLRLQQMPSLKIWLVKKAWNTLFRSIMIKRAKRNAKESLGDFELEYVKDDGDSFDYGINYLQCGHHKFLKEHGAEEIFPFVCLADIALSDAFGWGLIRSQTIADGFTHCDFRFKKGSATRITSKTLEIQRVIDKISAQTGQPLATR